MDIGGYTMSKTLSLLAVFISTSSIVQAEGWQGASAGVQFGQGNFEIVVPKSDFDFSTKGVHLRYLVQGAQSRLVMGAELSHYWVGGDIFGRKGREEVKAITDLSAIVGWDAGRLLPYAMFGLSCIDTDLHLADGYKFGAGADYAVSDRYVLGLRWTQREYDGPAQGADLNAPTWETNFSVRF